MAHIGLGIGTSHAPQLSTPPEEWGQRARADRRNPALAFRGGAHTFEELTQLALRAQVVDYLPCYRSETGTGCGMGFVAWQEQAHEAGAVA